MSAEPDAETRRLLTFSKDQRIRSSQDFAEIYAMKQRAGNSDLLIFARRNGLGHTRIGFSISRKHGNSVVRHRLRRILRESFRLEQHSIPSGLDLILIPGRASRDLTVDRCRRSLISLSRRLDRQLGHSADVETA